MRPSNRPILALAPLCGLLAACNPQSQPPARAPAAQNPGPPLTPDPMPPSYIGRWAATPDLCAAGAWVFTEKALNTAGEVGCTFTQVTPNDAGWIAEGACTAQAPAKPATLVLVTARSSAARTLAVSGGPFARAQVLVACDEATGAPPIMSQSRGAPVPAAAGAVLDADALDKAIADPAAGVQPFEFRRGPLVAKGWRRGGAVVKIVEPLPADAGRNSGERAFYFRPGSPDPFLVRDPQALYALEGGKLLGVYSRDGAALQPPTPRDRAEIEGQVLAHGRDLHAAAEG